MKTLKLIAVSLILAGLLAACAQATAVVNTEYVLTTALRDGNFVFLGVDGEINGVVNPALHAKPGEQITVMLVNSGDGTHDIVFDGIRQRLSLLRPDHRHRRSHAQREHKPCDTPRASSHLPSLLREWAALLRPSRAVRSGR